MLFRSCMFSISVKRFLSLTSIFAFALAILLVSPSRAENVLVVSEDMSTGYVRTAFKLWIDADRNGCDTRAEVLIQEALVRPKIGKNCALSGGSWLSPYDNKYQNNASALDIDHVVPLAEVWRSGAWKWSAAQREAYANDLNNPEVLVAVTASVNRSKGDKDISSWLPQYGQCKYIRDWIVVKLKYQLTVDALEAAKLNQLIPSCGITGVTVGASSASPTPITQQFKMPLITEYKLGVLLSKWSTYGFNKQPIVIQEKPTLSEYSCKQVSNEDTIKDIQPKWNSLVNAETQVTVTVYCTYDFDSKKVSSTPTPTQSVSQ